MEPIPEYDYYRIGRARIFITDTQDAVNRIKTAVSEGKSGYVCVSNMRTVVEANRDDGYQVVMENSLFNTPDGTPLIWCARAWGLKEAQRACGPHIFEALVKDTDSGLKHFFLGDTEDTLAKLTDKCRNEIGADIVGSYSPPFRPLEEYDFETIADNISKSGANIVWVSLRAPKQDFLSSMIIPYIKNDVVFVGVGAAFRMFLGEYKQPSGLLQKLGLAGLGMTRNTTFWKELKWYIKHGWALVCFLCSIKCRRLQGKKYYELL